MKTISLRKLFGNTFEDHEGRPGEVGGSLPRSGGKGKKSKSSVGTPKKTSNNLERITGQKFTPSAGQSGVMKGYPPKSKFKAIGSSLKEQGFIEYKDEYKQDWVTSYKAGKLRVHVSNDPDDDRLFVTVSEVSGGSNIPQD